MKCPNCGADNNHVTGHYGDNAIYRKCFSCGNSFKTVEKYDPEAWRHSGRKKKVADLDCALRD